MLNIRAPGLKNKLISSSPSLGNIPNKFPNPVLGKKLYTKDITSIKESALESPAFHNDYDHMYKKTGSLLNRENFDFKSLGPDNKVARAASDLLVSDKVLHSDKKPKYPLPPLIYPSGSSEEEEEEEEEVKENTSQQKVPGLLEERAALMNALVPHPGSLSSSESLSESSSIS